MSTLAPLLYLTGILTAALGILHFFFPILFDFRHAIPREGPPLEPFRLGPILYHTARRDVWGIAWLMNHHVSYTLVTIGLVDLFWTVWLRSAFGMLVALWIAVWWFMRAGTQLYLGRRRGDWMILLAFASFGLLHLVVAFA